MRKIIENIQVEDYYFSFTGYLFAHVHVYNESNPHQDKNHKSNHCPPGACQSGLRDYCPPGQLSTRTTTTDIKPLFRIDIALCYGPLGNCPPGESHVDLRYVHVCMYTKKVIHHVYWMMGKYHDKYYALLLHVLRTVNSDLSWMMEWTEH